MNGYCEQLLRKLSLVTLTLLLCVAAAPSRQHHPQLRQTRKAQKSPAMTKINPKDGAEMIYIPAGKFLMGDADQEDNPRHTVTLSAYYIYKNLVTVAMYRKFCQVTGKQMPPAPTFDPNWLQEDHPIVNVTWVEATAYCQWAGGSLPTEAQWEKAARGTDGRVFPWGNVWNSRNLWWSPNLGDVNGTAPVGKYAISPYGVTDMAGNVDQWCTDWFDENFLKSRLAMRPDPVNEGFGDGKLRVVRGGSWLGYNASYFRSSFRDYSGPSNRGSNGGFRCVRRLGPN